jgi:alkanesulfonate monooxygenase SsuD/methylene tetrahydromethanopterin reductase-like flavin-dependent oxidoreductase (luciferase family)
MQFGIFGGAQAQSLRPGAVMGQGFHDFIDFNVEAEALGYHSTFLVEHHFTGWHQVSAALTLLTWLAARTRAPPRHRRGATLAQSGYPCRTGRDA